MEARIDSGSTAADTSESRLLIFRKDVWTDIYFDAQGPQTLLANTNDQMATVTDTLSGTQDVVLIGHGVVDMNDADQLVYMWFRQDGTTVIDPVVDQASGFNSAFTFDVTDAVHVTPLGFLAAESGTLDLDLFAYQDGSVPHTLSFGLLLVWGMELAAAAATVYPPFPRRQNTLVRM